MKKPKARRKEVAILGPGRVGQAMGRLLRQAGVPVLFVAARRSAAARRAARFIGGGRPVGLDSPELSRASVFLLTTSDAALAPLARALAARSDIWKGKVVLHTSGSVPAEVLAPLRWRGASVGSLHPYQTIPTPAAGVRNLVGCFWGVEGDAAARRLAFRCVRLLRGKPFGIRAAQKTLYHASAFLVCPTLLTLMAHSERLLARVGVPERVARPMLAGFVEETVNSFRRMGAKRALTGPVVRGDWAVIRGHLGALRRQAPQVLPAYRALLGEIARLARRRLPRDLAGGKK